MTVFSTNDDTDNATARNGECHISGSRLCAQPPLDLSPPPSANLLSSGTPTPVCSLARSLKVVDDAQGVQTVVSRRCFILSKLTRTNHNRILGVRLRVWTIQQLPDDIEVRTDLLCGLIQSHRLLRLSTFSSPFALSRLRHHERPYPPPPVFIPSSAILIAVSRQRPLVGLHETVTSKRRC